MFIQTQETPNPNSLKFVIGKKVSLIGPIEISKDGAVTANSFKYKSPCPPNGKHKYQWTAKAKDKKGFGGKTLATAKASRMYPD